MFKKFVLILALSLSSMSTAAFADTNSADLTTAEYSKKIEAAKVLDVHCDITLVSVRPTWQRALTIGLLEPSVIETLSVDQKLPGGLSGAREFLEKRNPDAALFIELTARTSAAELIRSIQMCRDASGLTSTTIYKADEDPAVTISFRQSL